MHIPFHCLVYQVFYIDYGTVEDIFVEHVRLMRKEFAELMPQAFRGCLDHIRPAAGLWTREATVHFKKNVQDLKIYAKVTGVNTEVPIEILDDSSHQMR